MLGMTDTHFTSEIFPVRQLRLAGSTESVLPGGRHLLPLLPQALRGIKEIGVIGWGSQARAQAQNLRDSLAGTDIRVIVGLRTDSPSAPDARACGFDEHDDTLGEMYDVIARSDLALLLISDAAQAALHRKVFDALQPGSTLGLSHGFLLGHLRGIGESFPDDVNVVGVCPKGMGPSVRRLYEQGAATTGAGINCSFAVEQDIDGWATDIALAWAVGIGAPATFMTTLDNEYRSDIFGERAVLLGGLHGLVESLYRWQREAGLSPEGAFLAACESVTGPIRAAISHRGLRGLVDALTPSDRAMFAASYTAAYRPMAALLTEIYDEVDSGRELAAVTAAQERLITYPMARLEGTEMWEVGARVRAARTGAQPPIDPVAAGLFAALMVAQVDLLHAHRHPWSEIANESVIEVVDSLIPFMHARGVAHMIDNCSVTARLGARRWGPLFEAAFTREILPALSTATADAAAPSHAFAAFLCHPLHDVLGVLGELRPPIDIAVA